jgi:DNA polymerase alpha-associated DNA helicase A
LSSSTRCVFASRTNYTHVKMTDVLLPNALQATQALEAVCLIPILKAKKLILAGDPCQLGPTILSAKPSSSTGKIDKKKGPKDKPAGKVASTEGESVVAPPTSNGAEESAETIPVNDTAPALAPDEQLFESAKGLDLAQSSSDDNFLPTRLSLRPPRSLEMTLFGRLEKLYGPAIKRILTVQYRCVVFFLASDSTARASDLWTFNFTLRRMNTSIAAFPSKALYSSLLESAPTVADRTLTGLPLIDDSEEAVEFLEPTVVFIDTNGCEFYERTDEGGGGGEGSKRNENEAELVRSYVEKLVSTVLVGEPFIDTD